MPHFNTSPRAHRPHQGSLMLKAVVFSEDVAGCDYSASKVS